VITAPLPPAPQDSSSGMAPTAAPKTADLPITLRKERRLCRKLSSELRQSDGVGLDGLGGNCFITERERMRAVRRQDTRRCRRPLKRFSSAES
jgi:hypothetical protein